ncbi:MAG TPA: tetratricopeptide repeat protein [Chloroflexi bacterium]|nr:tetratricopeptide repeat protein [Chloroflexota bacterium]
MSHEYQRWNNCGPATLGMALSYYGYQFDQYYLAPILKPDPEDKNVSPEEMASFARSLGLGAVVRVNGTITGMKRLLSNGFPVVVEQWFIPHPNDEMGHYRVLRGYDDSRKAFIANDSYNGPKVWVPYGELDALWRVFNRKYLVIYRPEDEALLKSVLGEDWDERLMYARALERARKEVERSPDDAFAWFNMGNSYLGLEEPEEAVAAFEKAISIGLPWRMLWYQFGPFEAYLATGHYEEVLRLSESVLRKAPNLEELHFYRGMAYRALGREDEAEAEFRLALKYNPSFKPALKARNSKRGVSSTATKRR